MTNKAIFLDRDDTLIEDAGYISEPDQVKLLDGAAQALTALKTLGYKLVVVSNQSGVARGIITEKVLKEIHNRLNLLLAEKGAHLDKIYYCPYHPDGVVAKYCKESDWRKPNPGMLLAAADEMDIALGESWMVGNSIRDIEAGQRAGCNTILIDHPTQDKQPQPGDPKPDFKAVNIKEAVNIIKKQHRLHSKSPAQTKSGVESITDQDLNGSKATPSTVFDEPEQPKQQLTEQQADNRSQNPTGATSEELLGRILEQLKNIQRTDMFTEFSIMRLAATVLQFIVLFCLIISVWFLMSPVRRESSVFIPLGFAAVFQLMSLTFYTMQGRK